jgi:hypothetical protein
MSRANKRCSKTRYATRAQAEQAISAMARTFQFVYKKAYRCGKCRAWHITSTPRVGRRRQW